MGTVTEEQIDSIVESKLQERFAHILDDISFRIGQTYDLLSRVGGEDSRGKVFAEDLHIKDRVFLTGYTVTNNSPAAGSIAWTDLHIVYDGVDNTITAGNTANKFVWWSPTTTPTALQSSNTKPVLATGEVLLFINNGGTAKVMLSDTNQSLPSMVADGAVDTSAILANAVGSAQLADGAVLANTIAANAVTNAKIADGALTRTAQLGANVVTSGAIAYNAVTNNQLNANAVTSGKVADGAINRSGILSANTVTSAAVADGAVVRSGQLSANVVTATAIADNAVLANNIAANAITAAKVADGAINRAGILAANVVTTAAIADGAVGTTEIATGAVAASKLDILRHVLY